MQHTETAKDDTAVQSERISWRGLPISALLAAVAAAVANSLIFFGASALGFIPQSVLIPTAGGESPLTLGMVAISSVIGVMGAAAVFAVIALFVRHPVRLFRIVAVLVLVLSFATPLTIPGVPLSMILSMEAMHVAAWAVIVGLLTNLARRKEHA
jgi:hypothetical protein